LKKFKLVFVPEYIVDDYNNDNIDVFILFPDESVYAPTFFTIENIQHLIKSVESAHFWAHDMVIVLDLKPQSIYLAVNALVEDGIVQRSFERLGSISEIFKGQTYVTIESHL
jgi:hypothetical protein